MNYELSSTICATATAPGGAIGIIRVSGTQAFAAVSSLCSVCCNNIAANTVHFPSYRREQKRYHIVKLSTKPLSHSFTNLTLTQAKTL